ncbi:MAG: hypothetical protein AAGJ18_06435, partial [Bacteroidota bacterium]
AEKIDFIFKSLIGRSADNTEKAALATLQKESVVDFQKDRKGASELLTIGASPVNRRLNPADLAAYTMVASTVMNFDEFVMKR